MKILNPQTESQTQSFSEKFKNAKPFKHVVMNGFFTEEFCSQLLKEFPSFDEKLAINENGEVGMKAVHEKVTQIGPAYKALDELASSESFIKTIETITGIEGLRYDPYYFGGGTHENKHGQDLDPHVDFTHHPISGQHRRLNLIIYLNEHWEAEWGGNIEFHKNPRLPREADDIVSELPVFNKAVLFETNNISWHGFPRINLPEDMRHLSRKSFALYYYTDTRGERVKPHSTIYVERPLEVNLRSGQPLKETDIQTIEIALKRRDQHLERLYNNITGLMDQIDGLKWKVSQLDSKVAESHVNSTASIPDSDTVTLINRLHAIENSTSWRITRPLRQLKRWWNRSG